MESVKQDRLDEYLAANPVESVWFATPPMFAWVTGGSNLVDRRGTAGIAAVGYDGDDCTVVTSNIEQRRLLQEEIDIDVNVVAHQWYERDVAEAVADVASMPAAADFDHPRFDRISRSTVTQPLPDVDLDRYRPVCRETAEAVESVAREATPANTERALAARLHHALQKRGLESPVVLVGGTERVGRYRHFTPTDTPVGPYAVLTVVGARYGLHAAVTRTVAFGDAPDWLEGRYADVASVAATAAEATHRYGVRGGTIGDVFEAIRTAYENLGYRDEWQTHHQGGALGYATREWIATPGQETEIELPMVFGWNPTVDGAKVEDSILVTEDGVEVLSVTGDTHTVAADAVGSDFELPLPEILRP